MKYLAVGSTLTCLTFAACADGGGGGRLEEGGDSGGGSSDGVETSTGASPSVGGSDAIGGAILPSGGSATGGVATGGEAAESDLSSGQCRSVSDCPSTGGSSAGTVVTHSCASPGQPSGNTFSPGVQTWCGQIVCPSPPSPAPGVGAMCETDNDCMAEGEEPVASLCREGSCVVCEGDADCSPEFPRCAPSASGWAGPSHETGGELTCLRCTTDDDCSSDKPRCVYNQSEGLLCVECRAAVDCALGTCRDNSCQSECTSDAQCGDPQLICASEERCERRSCQVDADCVKNTACTEGFCARRACSVDQDCEGPCVNGRCYENYGLCSTHTAYP